MGVLLVSWGGAYIAAILAFCLAFIALILISVVLGMANKKQKTKGQINRPQQQANTYKQNYAYNNYATVQTRMSADSAAKTLRDYKILHDSGLLTDREFEEQKAKILSQLGL